MAWDTVTHRLVTKARLLLASPDVVYQAMEDYGQHVHAHSRLGDYDEDLETALAERNDRLIDLALARNAGSNNVVGQLYSRALTGTGDAGYDKAIRLACLANPNAANMLMSPDLKRRDEDEFIRLAHEGDDDELNALMRNANQRSYLAIAYNRHNPDSILKDLSDDRWLKLVRSSVGNKGINADYSTAAGPDMLSWEVQKSVVFLLKTAPVEKNWVRNLYYLLLTINPAKARYLESESEFTELLARWRSAKVPKMFKEDVEEEGYYTSATFVEEFCALIAALYGRVLADKKFVLMGALDAPDLAQRCAFYGRSAMTPEQMQDAWERDNDVFVFAALFNDQLLLKPESRRMLEEHLVGYAQHLYAERCKQLQEGFKWFNPTPVTDEVKEDLDVSAPSAEANAISNLSTQVTTLSTALSALSQRLVWGLLIIGALVLWRR